MASIKVSAVELGQELDEQNRVLDVMNAGTEDVLDQLQDDTKRLNKL